MAIVVVLAAEVAATLSATAAHDPGVTQRAPVRVSVAPAPYGGEPDLPRYARIPPGPRAAAVRFVRDYALWSDGRLAVIPVTDATRRLVWLLKHEGRHSGVLATDAEDSIRIAFAGAGRYLVTSAVGNFLVDQRGSRWLVVSLPGD
jgi:hypothetical protein